MTTGVDEVLSVDDVIIEPLTAFDRCDVCGAQAYVRTAHIASDLLWCAHHLAAQGGKLDNFIVADERDRLNA